MLSPENTQSVMRKKFISNQIKCRKRKVIQIFIEFTSLIDNYFIAIFFYGFSYFSSSINHNGHSSKANNIRTKIFKSRDNFRDFHSFSMSIQHSYIITVFSSYRGQMKNTYRWA